MSTTSPPPQGRHQHERQQKDRVRRNFVLPDGRKVYIAFSPEEAETLRQRLATIRDEPFEVAIYGSESHQITLQIIYNHYEERLEGFKMTHGEAYDEFKTIQDELDALRSELNILSNNITSLDANFSKYGYSAQLRTYDSSSDRNAPPISKSHDEDKDWSLEKTNGKVLKIYKKPTIRQYVYKGLVWRARKTTEVAPYELFFDLLYAGTLSINGDSVAQHPTNDELLRFSITFIMGWQIWSELNLIVSWFETDDILHRLSVVSIMVFLLGFTTNMLNAFQDTYKMLVIFYIIARIFMGSYFLILARIMPAVRGVMLCRVVLTVISSAIWVASIYVNMPLRLVAIWVAITFEFIGAIFPTLLIRASKHLPTRLGAWVDRVFEIYPAVNIEHKADRTNCFVTLVLGYSVVAIIYQNTAPSFFGLNAFFGKAALCLIQAFFFNWLYFEIDGADLYSHAIRRSVPSALLWELMHLPFIMSFILAASALSRLVLATDCRNTNINDLTATYKANSEPEILAGLRWFYCAGLGISLGSMGIISICHIHKEPARGKIRLSKRVRMTTRFAVCIILFCLPKAESLDSLQLVSITTGLMSLVLILELWGTSNPTDAFFGETREIKYTARSLISKTDLETAVRSGQVIDVSENVTRDV